MNDERLERVASLFEGARALPASERESWLVDECAGDDALAAEVRSLLGEHEQGGELLEPGTDAALLRRWVDARAFEDEARPPFEVPGYRILSRLGEGSQGAVYEAEQEHPKRCVALKLMRPSFSGESLRARFEREAQTLARLTHPGIATVLASGVVDTEFGELPFFAMELVRGRALTDYADAAELNQDARLELLTQVADAVEHAHVMGVVHRDLKPSNVLVDEDGRARVLDFGVARVLDSDADSSSLQTLSGEVVGTLAYMSPEQAEGRRGEIDERTDVFALGVLAFELVSGRLPRDLRGCSLPEALRALSDGSTTLLGSVDRRWRGDLETVVAKAMAHEKEQRYASAREFADELRRCVRREPIRARPATALYHLSRFVRRHRALSSALGGLLLSLTIGVVVSTSLFLSSRANEEEALWQSYVGKLVAAVEALDSGGSADVESLLASCPEELRAWEWGHLWRRAEGSERRLSLGVSEISSSPVTALAVDPTRRWVAAAYVPSGPLGEEHVVRVWELESESLVHEFDIGALRVDDLCFDAVGETLLASGAAPPWMVFQQSGSVLWELAGGEEVARIDEGAFELVRLPGPGTRWGMLTPTELCVWGPENGLEGRAPVLGGRSLALAPDGKRLAVGDAAGWVHVLDSSAWPESELGAIGPLNLSVWSTPDEQGRRGGVLALAFAPDGGALLAGLSGGEVVEVELENGAITQLLRGHRRAVHDVAYADAETVVSAGADGVLLLRDRESRTTLEVLSGHRDAINTIELGSGQRLYSAAEDGTVRIWDLGRAAATTTLPGSGINSVDTFAMRFSPSGEALAWHRAPGQLCVSSVGDGELLLEVPAQLLPAQGSEPPPEWPAMALAFDASGRELFVLARSLRRFEIESGRLLDEWEDEEYSAQSFAGLACSSELSAGGELWAWGRLDHPPQGMPHEVLPRTPGHLRVQRVDGGELLFDFASPAAPSSLQFTPDGGRLLSAHFDGSVRCWDLRSGELLFAHSLPGVSSATYLDLDPSGERYAVSALDRSDRRIFLGDANSGEPPRELLSRVTPLRMAFHPSEPRLCVGSWEGVVEVVDLERGAVVGIASYDSPVVRLLYDPTGQRLATAEQYGTHRILHGLAPQASD